MRICIPVLAIIIISFSCNQPVPKATVPVSTPVSTAYKYDTLEGVYSGDFGGSEIRIVLTHVTGIHAMGFDLHKGLRRNISGMMKANGNSFIFMLNEPGDHQFDGKFNFTIDTATFTLSGTWAPLNDKALSEKTFTLKKLLDTGMNQYEQFTVWSDSIGYFNLDKSGLCIYEFYPVINGKEAEQLVRIKGTWSRNDSVYTIDWETNTVFSSRKSIFIRRLEKIDTADEYGYPTLFGEGRKLRQDMY